MTFVEMAVLNWCYGTRKIMKHVEEMGMVLYKPVKTFWFTCWAFITPVLIGFVTIMGWINPVSDEFLGYEVRDTLA